MAGPLQTLPATSLETKILQLLPLRTSPQVTHPIGAGISVDYLDSCDSPTFPTCMNRSLGVLRIKTSSSLRFALISATWLVLTSGFLSPTLLQSALTLKSITPSVSCVTFALSTPPKRVTKVSWKIWRKCDGSWFMSNRAYHVHIATLGHGATLSPAWPLPHSYYPNPQSGLHLRPSPSG